MNQSIIMRPKGKLLDGLIDFCNYIPEEYRNSIIEVGSYAGESSVIFCNKFKKVYCIDPWMNGYNVVSQASNAQTMSEVEALFDSRTEGKNITKIKEFSVKAALGFKDKSLDIVYLDGDHSYKSIKEDIEAWLPKVREGGYLCGHDYTEDWFGVVEAVDERFGKPDIVFDDTSWLKRIHL